MNSWDYTDPTKTRMNSCAREGLAVLVSCKTLALLGFWDLVLFFIL